MATAHQQFLSQTSLECWRAGGLPPASQRLCQCWGSKLRVLHLHGKHFLNTEQSFQRVTQSFEEEVEVYIFLTTYAFTALYTWILGHGVIVGSLSSVKKDKML